jgi:hypothetical protein
MLLEIWREDVILQYKDSLSILFFQPLYQFWPIHWINSNPTNTYTYHQFGHTRIMHQSPSHDFNHMNLFT